MSDCLDLKTLPGTISDWIKVDIMSSTDNNNNKNDDYDKNSEQRSEFMILKSVTSCSKRVNYLPPSR